MVKQTKTIPGMPYEYDEEEIRENLHLNLWWQRQTHLYGMARSRPPPAVLTGDLLAPDPCVACGFNSQALTTWTIDEKVENCSRSLFSYAVCGSTW